MQEVKTGESKEGYVQLAYRKLEGVSVTIKGAYTLIVS